MARTKLVVAFALGSAILSSTAGALGLGAIEIKSALNQPLDARIPLLPADDRELETLSVRLATVEAFQRAGVDRPFFLTRLKFNVVSGDDPYVRIFTDQPVKEPFLDFLVEADWDRGRLIREFTLLLDPPVFDGAGQVAPHVVAAPAREQDQTVQAASPPSTFAASASAAPAQEPVTRATSQQYGPVSANDTLWRIAQSVRPDPSISMNQMMVAILRANPDAFIGGDMNRLRRGSTLTIPDAATITAISRTAADQEARDQLQRWRQSPATTPAQPSGRLQVVASEQAQPSDSDAQEQTSEQAEFDSMRRELTTYRERSLSLEAENEDLKAQVEGLKQELAQLERLISLEADRPAIASEADAQAAEGMPTEAVDPETEAALVEPDVEESAVVEAAPPASLPAAPQDETPGFLDDPRNLALLGGLLLALLGLIYLWLRRRRSAEPEQPLAEAAPVSFSLPAADSEPVETQPEETDDADSEEPLDVMAILSEDSDVLSEADLYIGHGRYEQARELLETALDAEPGQPQLRLKLLETLALMQNSAGFIEHAQTLRDQVGETDSMWLQVQKMGRELMPAEPLFAAAATSAEVLDEFELPADESDALAPVAAATEPDEVDESFDLEFDLPEVDEQAMAEEGAVAEEEVVAEEDTEFPIVGDSSLQSGAELGVEHVEAASLDDVSLELPDLQFDVSAVDSDDENVLEFAQPDLAEATTDDAELLEELENLDEVGVKLNLARAYIDLGDHDGARSLLSEVMEEGSSQQQTEAETLLGQIA